MSNLVVFDTEAARRLIDQVLDTRFPPVIRAVVKVLSEACDYIDEIEKGVPLQ